MVKANKTIQLSERAMLVQLKVSVWSGRTKDKKVSNEVKTFKKAEDDAGAWWTYLIPKKAISQIWACEMYCRSLHYKLTLPWNDEGQRILSSDMYMDYMKQMRKATQKFDEAVETFLKEYPTIMASARKRLGDLYDGKTLPSIDNIRGKFGHSVEVFPLPRSEDFRVNLNNDDVKEIQNQITNSINSKMNEAMAELWNRLAQMVEKIAITLSEPKKIFRDSLISNLKEFCELVPKLNITSNKELENMRKEIIEQLAELKPDNLRESKKERKEASQKAKDVLEKIKGFSSL